MISFKQMPKVPSFKPNQGLEPQLPPWWIVCSASTEVAIPLACSFGIGSGTSRSDRTDTLTPRVFWDPQPGFFHNHLVTWEKSTLKDWQVLSLGDAWFLQLFRGCFKWLWPTLIFQEYCHGRPPGGQDLTPVDHKFVDRPSPTPKAGGKNGRPVWIGGGNWYWLILFDVW